MELDCQLVTLAQQLVLLLSGEIDLATVPLLRNHLSRALDGCRGTTLVVDLDGVTAVDDAGLGALLGAAGRAREHGGDLVVVCTEPTLRRRLEVTRLDRAIEVRDRIT
jgi:anti-sigma B factor antagonist